jgi:hypothetical protein
MSDYMPDPNRFDPNRGSNYDRYGNANFNYEAADTGKGPYVLLGLLVAIGLVGGLLYFNGPKEGSNTAQAPVIQAVPAPERPSMGMPAARPEAPQPETAPATEKK